MERHCGDTAIESVHLMPGIHPTRYSFRRKVELDGQIVEYEFTFPTLIEMKEWVAEWHILKGEVVQLMDPLIPVAVDYDVQVKTNRLSLPLDKIKMDRETALKAHMKYGIFRHKDGSAFSAEEAWEALCAADKEQPKPINFREFL